MNNITHMYAIGDSFAFGQGLKGFVQNSDGSASFNETLKNTVFSGIIANKLNIENYLNVALPGSSNDRTYRRTIMELSIMMSNGLNPKNIFALLNITHSARIEVFDTKSNSYRQLITNHAPPISGKPLYDYWKIYSTYFDNIHENVDRYLMQVLSLQMFFEKHNIRYLMVDSMSESEEFITFLKNNRKILSAYINRRCYPEMQAFSNWARDKGFKPTPCHHTNEEAHAAWADHLLKYIEQEKLLEL